jgi:hypothetical protein
MVRYAAGGDGELRPGAAARLLHLSILLRPAPDTLWGASPAAEGRHYRAVIAPQNQNVGGGGCPRYSQPGANGVRRACVPPPVKVLLQGRKRTTLFYEVAGCATGSPRPRCPPSGRASSPPTYHGRVSWLGQSIPGVPSWLNLVSDSHSDTISRGRVRALAGRANILLTVGQRWGRHV